MNEAGYPVGDLKTNTLKYLVEMMEGFQGRGRILSAESDLIEPSDKNKSLKL